MISWTRDWPSIRRPPIQDKQHRITKLYNHAQGGILIHDTSDAGVRRSTYVKQLGHCNRQGIRVFLGDRPRRYVAKIRLCPHNQGLALSIAALKSSDILFLIYYLTNFIHWHKTQQRHLNSERYSSNMDKETVHLQWNYFVSLRPMPYFIAGVYYLCFLVYLWTLLSAVYVM
jgi:hypothetical protein